MVQIIPAVLSKTEEEFIFNIERLSRCESLKNGWIHIDFADNEFVPNQTIVPGNVARVHLDFKKEAHLMVSHPIRWVDELVGAGFKRIIFHIESGDDVDKVLDYIKEKGLEAGLAIKMDTAIEKLEEYKEKLDVLLVMSIEPGFQGQPFIAESFNRIRELKSKNWPSIIAVDGSVKDENAKQLVEAGIDNLVVGSYLLKGDIEENLERIWEVLHG
jgi:ribulose-phosphate 3-epimerase